MKTSLQPKRHQVLHHSRLFRPLPMMIIFLAVVAMIAQAGGEKPVPVKRAQPGLKIKVDQVYSLAGINVRSYVEVSGKILQTGEAWDECTMTNPVVDGERVYLLLDKVSDELKKQDRRPFFYLDSLMLNGKPAAGEALILKARPGAKMYHYDLANSSKEIGPVNVTEMMIPLNAVDPNGRHRIELTPKVGDAEKTIITYRSQWTLVQPWER